MSEILICTACGYEHDFGQDSAEDYIDATRICPDCGTDRIEAEIEAGDRDPYGVPYGGTVSSVDGSPQHPLINPEIVG